MQKKNKMKLRDFSQQKKENEKINVGHLYFRMIRLKIIFKSIYVMVYIYKFG